MTKAEPTTVGEALMGGAFAETLAIFRTGKQPGKRGRPAARMTLVVDAGVAVLREGSQVHHLSSYVAAMVPQWPEVYGVSFEDDDTWAGRQRLASAASSIAERVGDGVLVCDSGDYRLGPLIAALYPYADLAIVAAK